MKKLRFMKALLLMCLLMVGIGNAWGEEVVYKTALFGLGYNSKGVSSYAGEFSSTNNGFTVDISQFNNNNNQWDYIKTGNKSGVSVGTITTNAAIDKAVTKVVVTIDAITASNVNSITLYSGTSADDCTTVEGTYSKATGAQVVTISSPVANRFYKVSFDCKQGSSNGLVAVSKVEYYVNDEGGGSTPEPTKYTVTVANNIANGTVTAYPASATEGDEITLTATPADGYEFGSWNVTNASTGAAITVTDNKFIMPATNVNVSATFNEVQGGGSDGDTQSITFDFVNHPSGWPDKSTASEGSYTYNLDGVDYTFTTSNTGDGIYLAGTSGTSGYLLLAVGNKLGLPVINGYKLVKVIGTLNSSGNPSTSSKVSITDDLGNIVSGGNEQTWADKGESYTYDLSGTWANRVYYLTVSNRNCQMITLSLTYEKAGADDIATHTLESISIKNEPSMTEYYVGDIFDPTGLVITAKYDDGTEDVEYLGNEDKFTFDPDIEASLTTSNTSVAITYGGKTVNLPIIVEAKSIANTKESAYTVPQARALIDAGKGLSTPVYVKGYVTSIVTEYKQEYGNISFDISETGSTSAPKFQFYRNQESSTTTYSEAPDITKGDYVVGFGYLTKFNTVYEYKAGNYLVEHVKPETVLTGITLQGAKDIAFTVGDEFNHNGVTVIANFENGTTKDVTNEAEFSIPDMNTVGKKVVTVTYKSESTTYTVIVNPADIPADAVVVTYNFHEKNDYPENFPEATGTSVTDATKFVISGNDIILQAPDAYYIVNNNAPVNLGFLIGKSKLNNGNILPETAYIGFPARSGYKLTKVVATTTSTTAGVDLNIYNTSFTPVSDQIVATSQTKATYTFNITNSVSNTEYRLTTSSKDKNMQFDNIVLVYEAAGTDPDTPIDPEPIGVKYVLVEDETDLTDGEYVITVKLDDGIYKAMTSTIDQGYINETSVNVVDNTINVLNGAAVWNVTCGADDDSNPNIRIMYNGKYLSNADGIFAFSSTPDHFYCFLEEGLLCTSDWNSWFGHTDGFMISSNWDNAADVCFFKKIESEDRNAYTITWSVNGTDRGNTTAYEGDNISFTTPTGSFGGYTFMGWTNAHINGTLPNAPEILYAAGTTAEVIDNITYYAVFAREVNSGITEDKTITLDFVNDDWGIPVGSTNKITDTETEFTYNGYRIKAKGSSDGGVYIGTKDKKPVTLMLGKMGAYLTIPELNTPIKKITCLKSPNTSLSGDVKWNVYSGETAVSEELTGCTNGGVFEIQDGYWDSPLMIMVTSSKNTQFTGIEILTEVEGVSYTDYCTLLPTEWSDIAIAGTFPNSDWQNKPLYLNRQDYNKFVGTIDASKWEDNTDYEFKLYNVEDGVDKWWGTERDLNFKTSVYREFTEEIDNHNMTWIHNADYPSYYVVAEYLPNERDGYWHVTITGIPAGDYLPGNWNNWLPYGQDVKFENDILVRHLEANTDYEFKLYNSDHCAWHKEATSTEESSRNIVESTAGMEFTEEVKPINCKLTTTEAGDYMFFIDKDGETPYISVVYPSDLAVYKGSNARTIIKEAAWDAAQTEAPNAIALVSSTKKSWAESQTNVVVLNAERNYTCQNFVLTDKKPVYVPCPFVANTAEYRRSNSNQWGTICLPFAVSSGIGIQYYQLEAVTDTEMTFTKIDNVEANQPAVYSIGADGGDVSISLGNSDVAVTTENNPENNGITLVGVQSETVTLPVKSNNYYIANNKFWRPTTNAVNVAPQRAYFHVSENSPAKAGSYTIGISDEDVTAIDALLGNSSEVSVEGYYNVEGITQNGLQKGINIVKFSNGLYKKIVIK